MLTEAHRCVSRVISHLAQCTATAAKHFGCDAGAYEAWSQTASLFLGAHATLGSMRMDKSPAVGCALHNGPQHTTPQSPSPLESLQTSISKPMKPALPVPLRCALPCRVEYLCSTRRWTRARTTESTKGKNHRKYKGQEPTRIPFRTQGLCDLASSLFQYNLCMSSTVCSLGCSS